MRLNNGKNLASRIGSEVRNQIDRHQAMTDTIDTVRDRRSGWRHTGALQYARYYSSEGVYAVGIGGPPVVGK